MSVMKSSVVTWALHITFLMVGFANDPATDVYFYCVSHLMALQKLVVMHRQYQICENVLIRLQCVFAVAHIFTSALLMMAAVVQHPFMIPILRWGFVYAVTALLTGDVIICIILALPSVSYKDKKDSSLETTILEEDSTSSKASEED